MKSLFLRHVRVRLGCRSDFFIFCAVGNTGNGLRPIDCGGVDWTEKVWRVVIGRPPCSSRAFSKPDPFASPLALRPVGESNPSPLTTYIYAVSRDCGWHRRNVVIQIPSERLAPVPPRFFVIYLSLIFIDILDLRCMLIFKNRKCSRCVALTRHTNYVCISSVTAQTMFRDCAPKDPTEATPLMRLVDWRVGPFSGCWVKICSTTYHLSVRLS